MAQQVTHATPAKSIFDLPTALPVKASSVIDVANGKFNVGIDFITICIPIAKVAPMQLRTDCP
eukprot:14872296-Ditylum_brightwellii.AAC.1